MKNARDKIMLKKVNAELFDKLAGLHKELERYKQNEAADNVGPVNDTERIISEIIKLEQLRKGRFLIE